jgi:hypothetical protein
MAIAQLIKSNRRSRKQRGQRIETPTSWMLRYYVDGHQKCITLAPKNDLYRSWADVEPLIERALSQVRSEAQIVTDTIGLIEYVEKHYLPWAAENKAAVTADSYEKVWRRYWKPSFAASLKLTDLRTAEVTAVLTHHVKERIGRTDTLSLQVVPLRGLRARHCFRLLQLVVYWPVGYSVASAIGRRWHRRIASI